jgi:hypothetical protein
MRFALDLHLQVVAVGTQTSEIYLWSLNGMSALLMIDNPRPPFLRSLAS